MIRILTVAAASFALFAGVASAASAPNALIAQDSAKPLTLIAAKHQVADWLNATGHGALHVGEAEFDRILAETADWTWQDGFALSREICTSGNA